MTGFTEFEPDGNRRMTDPALEVIVHKVTRMATDLDKMANSVEKLSESMGRIVLVEERIGNMVSNLERIHKRLDEGDKRMHGLELSTLNTDASAKWIDRALVGLVGAIGVFAANKLGLM